MRIDLARINYVLIPKTKEGRDRFRAGRLGRAVAPLLGIWGSLTDEGRTWMLVSILVGAFAVDVRSTSAYVLFCVLVGMLAGSLVASRRLRLPDLEVDVEAPRRVTVDEEVRFTITCRRQGDGDDDGDPSPPLRIRGPFLTWDGKWTAPAPAEGRVAAGGALRAEMRARFTARGVHHLDPFTAAAVVPLGLACGPRRASEAAKVYVVPRIANVTRLPPTIATRHQPGGVALASKSGESMDLNGVRPYRPGDPVRDLHAKSWARTGIPVVREYQQEYFTRVGVVLDSDAEDPRVLDAAIELAAGVIARLSRGDALVDVLVVGDHVHELTLGRSLGYLDQALELLATVEKGPPLRAKDLVRRLDPHLAQLSSVIVIALKEGDERRALQRMISDRGVACTVISVDDKIVSAIQAKEPLAW
jgi:uncharacterized protein (DUF58 family)